MNENRIKLSVNEIEKIKHKYKNVPDDYLDYLKFVGWGSFRQCSFMVSSEPLKLKNLDIETDIDETDLVFFGDDFDGDFAGFNLKNNGKVIEWWHESDEIHETGKTFYEYIREKMGMDKHGNDL